MGILVDPFTNRAELIELLKRDLYACPEFNPEVHTVSQVESSQSPELACRARIGILLEAYSGDYHTDSFQTERIVARIHDGREAIWFWGSAGEVRKFRESIKRQTLQEGLRLGTVSVLSADEEFGKGYGELCRSGSVDQEIGAKAPILKRTMDFMTGEERWLHERFHTLILVPRNARSVAGRRGGEAINKIHVKYVRSRFWGFAPWYVMQGGLIEHLDFRETNRNPEDVARALTNCLDWHFFDRTEAEYAKSLCTLNFGVAPRVVHGSSGSDPELLRARLLLPTLDLRSTNHGTLQVMSDGGDASFMNSLTKLNESNVCCGVIKICLSDRNQVGAQRLAAESGFRLTAVVPPKSPAVKRDDVEGEEQRDGWGLWCRPRLGSTLVQPFYAAEAGESEAEVFILEYLRNHLQYAGVRLVS